jgi:ribosomal 50S subunit-recycling heat shock protein
MRIDKFLNSVNLTKQRSTAKDMIEFSAVYLNGNIVKPSKDVKIGDIIELKYIESSKKYEIIEIPKTKNTPKSAKFEYIKEIN